VGHPIITPAIENRESLIEDFESAIDDFEIDDLDCRGLGARVPVRLQFSITQSPINPQSPNHQSHSQSQIPNPSMPVSD
jgi:hypothetical protein